jgi:hypothetical protein
VLDEFVADAGCHRTHAIRILAGARTTALATPPGAQRTYDEAVREALVIMWEAADCIGGKQLKGGVPGSWEKWWPQVVQRRQRRPRSLLDQPWGRRFPCPRWP